MSSVDLTNELRLAKPRAPEQLRERVLALSERPVREPRFSVSLPSRFTVRRVAFVAVPAVFAVAVGAAVIHGIANSGGSQQQTISTAERAVARPRTPVRSTTTPSLGAHDVIAAPKAAPGGQKSDTGSMALSGGKALQPPSSVQQFVEQVPNAKRSVLAPSKTRLQDYRASLTVRVDGLDELSSATQKAMQVTRALGGYIVGAHTNQAKQGYSSLLVRVPIVRVQDAIARFSALGTIAAQDIRITDVQGRFNRLVKRIGALRVAIAKIDDKLADATLSNEQRVLLEERRARLAATLEAVRTSKARTSHRASLATVSLGLTTREAVVPAKPHHRGPLGRALHDAGTILAKEASWALYALIVLGPIAVIALVAFLLARGGRRLADRRLLESS